MDDQTLLILLLAALAVGLAILRLHTKAQEVAP